MGGSALGDPKCYSKSKGGSRALNIQAAEMEQRLVSLAVFMKLSGSHLVKMLSTGKLNWPFALDSILFRSAFFFFASLTYKTLRSRSRQQLANKFEFILIY